MDPFHQPHIDMTIKVSCIRESELVNTHRCGMPCWLVFECLDNNRVNLAAYFSLYALEYFQTAVMEITRRHCRLRKDCDEYSLFVIVPCLFSILSFFHLLPRQSV